VENITNVVHTNFPVKYNSICEIKLGGTLYINDGCINTGKVLVIPYPLS